MTSPGQTITSRIGSTSGLGLTVIVNDLALAPVLVQPSAEVVVTVMVDTKLAPVRLSLAVKNILPEPLAAKPIATKSPVAVQLNEFSTGSKLLEKGNDTKPFTGVFGHTI